MNINKLRGKIVEKGMNTESLADEIGCDRSTLYRAFKKPEKMTIGMAKKITIALEMTNQEAQEIFLD